MKETPQIYYKFMHESEVISQEQIQSTVELLGKAISKDYLGKELVFLGILKGSVLFYADLARVITMPVYFEFIRISSYRDKMTSGEVEILEDLKSLDLDNKHVLIIEDIVDTGNSLRVLIDHLEKNTKLLSVNICTFLIKDEVFKDKSLPIRYSGLVVDGFVVGYGMDYAEKYRNIPIIRTITSD